MQLCKAEVLSVRVLANANGRLYALYVSMYVCRIVCEATRKLKKKKFNKCKKSKKKKKQHKQTRKVPFCHYPAIVRLIICSVDAILPHTVFLFLHIFLLQCVVLFTPSPWLDSNWPFCFALGCSTFTFSLLTNCQHTPPWVPQLPVHHDLLSSGLVLCFVVIVVVVIATVAVV